MNPMNVLRMNFFKSLIQYKMLLVGISLAFAVLSQVYFQVVPKRFKITTTVSVQPQFFQIPLVRDFVPESFDGAELRSQREALILRSLSPEFLATIIDRYKLGGKKSAAEMSSSEVAEVSRRFEIIPIGATNFLISFFSTNGDDGYKVIRDFLAQIKKTMGNERGKTLLRIHDAIQERLEALSMKGGGKASSPSVLSARPDLLRQEIVRVQEELDELRRSYSEKHPQVAALARKLESLNRWSKPGSEDLPATESDEGPIALPMRQGTFSSAGIDESSKDLFKDLLKKYHYLEVVIYLDQQNQDGFLTILQEPFIPTGPIWPKRPILLLWGVISGFLIASVTILLLEGLRERRRRMSPAGSIASPDPAA